METEHFLATKNYASAICQKTKTNQPKKNQNKPLTRPLPQNNTTEKKQKNLTNSTNQQTYIFEIL